MRVPNKEDLHLAVVGSFSADGKISLIAVDNGGVWVRIGGGKNPGEYRLRANLTGAFEAALVGLTNKATVYAGLQQGNSGLEIDVLAVYSN